jgi:hypothetical protein
MNQSKNCKKEKYLVVTVGDNDFYNDVYCVCNLLYYHFQSRGEYPETEKDLELLKPIIQNLIYQSTQLRRYNNSSYPASKLEYFVPDLWFADKFELKWLDDDEFGVVPMFSGSKVFIK